MSFTTFSFIRNMVGADLSKEVQIPTAKSFKNALGIAVWISLIYGFFGYHSLELGQVFLVCFSASYGAYSWKWLQTPEGRLYIDGRLDGKRDAQVMIANIYWLFSALILISVLVVLCLPMLLMQNTAGLWISIVLVMACPTGCFFRQRQELRNSK